jgi:hypothetical protein
MRTLRNRRIGKRTRKGGLIKKRMNEWTNVSEKSESQVVNDYRRMEEEIMRLLAKNCQSEDSNECLRDESGVLLASYQEKCDAYRGYEDEPTFSELLSIKDTIGELIRLRVQDSGRFPVKLTDNEEQKRIRKAHRDRIYYWSIIYTGIKQIFDTVRQKRYDTKIAKVKEEYESLRQLFDEPQCKSIKDAYEQTASLIKVLEKEDALMGNSNESVIASLIARNEAKKELYDKAVQMPQRRAQFSLVEKKMKELGLEEVEEKTRQDSQSQMIKDSITRMDREQQRRLEQEEERVRREEKERIASEMAKEAAKQKMIVAQVEQSKKKQKEAQEKQEIEAAIKDSHEREIIEKWNFLSSVSPSAMVSKESKYVMKQYDDHIKRILQNSLLLQGEKIRQIKEITTRWEAFLDAEAQKTKTKKSAADRASATSPTVSKYDSVNEVYRWENIQDLIETLADSELKQQLSDIDSQIDALVNSEMDIDEMNKRVSPLMEQGELFIIRDELIKLTRKIHNTEERSSIMRSNRLLNELPDLPIDEKNVEMKKILSNWESKALEANAIQTHRDKLDPELFQRLVRLKEERKLIDPEDPRLKIINMHNGLIDKMIYREPIDVKRITEQIIKWESV